MIGLYSKKKFNQQGFTIIELLVATLIFSTILLVATFAIIQVSRVYIRGYIGATTQNTNRSILDQLTQQLQLSTNGTIILPASSPSGAVYWFCVNGDRYTYVYNYAVGDPLSPTKNIFLQDKDPSSSCSGPADLNCSSGCTGKELLTKNMQILPPSFGGSIIREITSNGQNLYQVNLNVLYGITGTYTPLTHVCVPISAGGAFCSPSSITTTIQQRT